MIDQFQLYRVYLELMYYTYKITLKYPKVERYCLVYEMKQSLYRGMREIILCRTKSGVFNFENLKVEFNLFLVYIRISYHLSYINSKNYASFSRKILKLEKMVDSLEKY